MELVTGHIGWIEVVCGPMFSGKSEELIRRLRRARDRAQTGAGVQAHAGRPLCSRRNRLPRRPAHEIRSGDRRQGHFRTSSTGAPRFSGIDESNFFGPDLVDVAGQLADTGKQVIIAGLDTDYLGRPFPPMPDLLCLAESITKTLAICMRCGNPAKHTQRLVESHDLIVVGAAGMYEARCRRCFEPGVPKQEVMDFTHPALRGKT